MDDVNGTPRALKTQIRKVVDGVTNAQKKSLETEAGERGKLWRPGWCDFLQQNVKVSINNDWQAIPSVCDDIKTSRVHHLLP